MNYGVQIYIFQLRQDILRYSWLYEVTVKSTNETCYSESYSLQETIIDVDN